LIDWLGKYQAKYLPVVVDDGPSEGLFNWLLFGISYGLIEKKERISGSVQLMHSPPKFYWNTEIAKGDGEKFEFGGGNSL